jgi:hypothetical protein
MQKNPNNKARMLSWKEQDMHDPPFSRKEAFENVRPPPPTRWMPLTLKNVVILLFISLLTDGFQIISFDVSTSG